MPDYNALEGTVSVSGAASAARTGQQNGVAIIGGYNASTADSSVTAGEATLISNPADATDTFGDSEIPRAAAVASANGVGTIYGVPVPETQTTESFSSTSSFTVSNTPVFNPAFHPDHSVDVRDTSAGVDLDVNIVYADTPSTPSASDTVNFNPINGKGQADASSNLDVTYTYGDYQTAIEAAADENVRYLLTMTEAASVKATLKSELEDIANDFDFKRGVVSADPEISAGNISSYTPDEEDWRMVEVAPAIATNTDDETVRTAAAVGGFLAAQPIGPDGSGLYDDVSGLDSLNTSYRASEAKDFSGVTSLTRTGTIATAETTSTVDQFRFIYAAEIIDDVASALFQQATNYAGGPQDLSELETLLSVVCQRKSRGNPPLLGFADDRDVRPYDVSVAFGSDNTIADAGVTIVPYPIAETVDISITVADGFVEFGGVN